MLVRPRGEFFARIESLKEPGETEFSMTVRMGIAPTTYRRWKWGSNRPIDEAIDMVGEKMGISPFWLKFGIGPKDIESARKWFEKHTTTSGRDNSDPEQV
jgi:hypothetical protein